MAEAPEFPDEPTAGPSRAYTPPLYLNSESPLEEETLDFISEIQDCFTEMGGIFYDENFPEPDNSSVRLHHLFGIDPNSIQAHQMLYTKDWHGPGVVHLRNNVIHKIIADCIPKTTWEPLDINDRRVQNFIAYAQIAEAHCYCNARNIEQYYTFIAERIHEILVRTKAFETCPY